MKRFKKRYDAIQQRHVNVKLEPSKQAQLQIPGCFEGMNIPRTRCGDHMRYQHLISQPLATTTVFHMLFAGVNAGPHNKRLGALRPTNELVALLGRGCDPW